jgi:RimJ/RimL family protein N-acetyltransferase
MSGADRPIDVQLRPTTPGDIPALFAFQADPAANELARTKPRDRAAFEARWTEIFADPACGVTPRVIVADGAVVGQINIVRQNGVDSLGYWVDRAQWGRGIASRAVGLMLDEFVSRPLMAQVAEGNVASLRALQRHGFEVIGRAERVESARHLAHWYVTLSLR